MTDKDYLVQMVIRYVLLYLNDSVVRAHLNPFVRLVLVKIVDEIQEEYEHGLQKAENES